MMRCGGIRKSAMSGFDRWQSGGQLFFIVHGLFSIHHQIQIVHPRREQVAILRSSPIHIIQGKNSKFQDHLYKNPHSDPPSRFVEDSVCMLLFFLIGTKSIEKTTIFTFLFCHHIPFLFYKTALSARDNSMQQSDVMSITTETLKLSFGSLSRRLYHKSTTYLSAASNASRLKLSTISSHLGYAAIFAAYSTISLGSGCSSSSLPKTFLQM